MNHYILITAVSMILGATTGALGQGTAFTYQGRLNDGPSPANGSYDLQFTIHDALSGGNQVGGILTNEAAAVSNGLFTVTLDFGGGVFTGANRWLEIGVRTNGGGAFDTLVPRQFLAATPYAITAGGVSGTVNGSLIIPGSVQDAALSTNVALRTGGNTFSGTQTINGALNLNSTFKGFGDLRLYAFQGNGSNGTAFVQARDDSLTSSIDLVFRSQLNGAFINALRIASNGAVTTLSNVGIGTASPAFPLSFPDTVGDKISLWGASGNHFGLGIQPKLLQIHTDLPANDIAFGHGQSSNLTETVRFKGNGNVGIGTTNPAAKLDVVGTIKATAFSGIYTGDGSGLTLSSNVALRTGGNTFSGTQTINGPLNLNSTFKGFGDFRLYAFQGNGSNGAAFVQARDDSPSSSIDLVLRSQSNGSRVDALQIKASGDVGIGTATPGKRLQVGGASGTEGMIRLHSDSAVGSATRTWDIGVPKNDTNASGKFYSFVIDDLGFGTDPEFMVQYGTGNVGIGTTTPSALLHVRQSSTNAQPLRIENSTGNPQLEIFADGQVNVTGPFYALGNAEVWGEISTTAINLTSDRNAKEHFTPVNPRAVLDKVAQLPITEWQYKANGEARHIGPVAQDFHQAFGLGRDDKHITSVDADGVALAAIQGLNEKLDERNARIQALEKSVVELKELVTKLAGQQNGGAK